MSKTQKAVAVFILVECVLAGLVWLSGYDFNARSMWVAYGAAWSLVVGALATRAYWELAA